MVEFEFCRLHRLTQQIDRKVPSLMRKLTVDPLLAMVIFLTCDRILPPAKNTSAPSKPSHARPQSHPPQTPQPSPIVPCPRPNVNTPFQQTRCHSVRNPNKTPPYVNYKAVSPEHSPPEYSLRDELHVLTASFPRSIFFKPTFRSRYRCAHLINS